MADSGNPSDHRLVWRSDFPEKNKLHLLEVEGRTSSMDCMKLLDGPLEARGFRDSRDRSELRVWRNDLFAVLRDVDNNVLDIMQAERNENGIAWTSGVPDDVRDGLMNAPAASPRRA